MLPAKKKELTELQQKFLEALFGEAKGDPSVAKKIAGYDSSTATSGIIKSVQSEIIEYSKLYLATHSPQALVHLMDMLFNPAQEGASTKLKVIQEILNRAGVAQPQDGNIHLNVPRGGIIIMPAKDISQQATIDLQRDEYKEINDTYMELIDESEEV